MCSPEKNRFDVYHRKAKEQGWRAKCAFKLLQIDEKFNIFEGVTRAVDLCAAPGSWSQVLSRKLYMGETIILKDKTCMFYNEIALHDRLGAQEKRQFNKNESARIVAVDLQPMSYLPGVTQIQGDITQISVAQEIIKHFEDDLANLVVFDGAAEKTFLISMDIYLQSKLLLAALYITCNVLKPEGTFVAKLFKEKDNSLLNSQLLSLFKEVHVTKPRSSADSNIESFVVCRNYSPPKGFDPKLMIHYLDTSNTDFSPLSGINRVIIPFITCGDVSAFDSDLTNTLSIEAGGVYKNTSSLLPTTAVAGSSKNIKKKADSEHSLKNLSTEDSKEKKTEVNPIGVSKLEEEEVVFNDEELDQTENTLDNGPYHDLLQKIAGIKDLNIAKAEEENVQRESGLQFLYEDEDTDPELIRECIERMQISSEHLTCNCTFYE